MDTHHGEMSDEEKMMWRTKHREYKAIRVLTAVVVVIFVFWCGFEFGEIRASIGLEHGGGSYRMMQGGWGGNTVYNGMRTYPTMMQPLSTYSVTASVPATPPAPSKTSGK